VFDGNAWLEYVLDGLPSDYRRPGDSEQVRVKFRTDAPNGLLWYVGSEQRATHLSVKVRHRVVVVVVNA